MAVRDQDKPGRGPQPIGCSSCSPVRAHPTLSEIVKEAALAVERRQTYG